VTCGRAQADRTAELPFTLIVGFVQRGGPSLRRLVIASLIVVIAAACSGEGDVRDGAPPRAPRSPAPDVPAFRPQTIIGVVDGDTGRRVSRAVVRIRGTAGETNRRGIVRLALEPRGRARARISAPGYIERRVSIPLRGADPVTVPLWRRKLQWPIYGATPARTQAHGAIKIRPPFRVVWKRNMRSLLEFPAVVWEGVAYITNGRGVLSAVSMRNGRVIWRKRIGKVAASSPAVEPKRRELVVTTKEPGRIKILDMATGKVRWRYATARGEGSPVIVRGIAYLGDESGRIYALDVRRRKMRWVFSGAGKITSSPAVTRGRLYFGDYAGRVYALNARSGRRIWTGSAGSRVYGTVAVARGRVFAPSVFSGLSALSARTGRLLWRIPVGVYLYSSPAYYRKRVYFGTYAGLVYSVSPHSGRILWRRSTGGAVSGAIVVVNGVVYAGSFNGRITGWNWRTGRRLWSFPDGRYVPVSGNGGRLLMHGHRDVWAVAPKRRG
jgi:outer membrane protein assembly factor BamB